MADKTFIIEVKSTGTGLVIKQIEGTTDALNKNTAAQTKSQKAQKKSSKGANDYTKRNKGVADATNNSTHAFAKMAQQMNGIVPVYATVAANVFAITAAFGALERAADFKILIDSADSLATQTGRSLTSLAENMKEITGSAISMKEALVQASIAASAGFDNSTIEELTQVARNASVALGREMTDSLNRVFKGAIKAEPELLDELGIILRLETAANKYALALGKTAKELTTFEKQQAVVNEVLEQGQKKFGRLSEIDPNPFTQLSAAFSDITTQLVNLVNVPLSGFIGFFTENIASLTAAIVLLAASVAKQALPALTAMGEGAIASFVGIGNSAQNAAKSLQKFTDTRIKAAQSSRVTSTLNAELELVRKSASSAALDKIFDKSAAAADRLKVAIRSVQGSITALSTKAKKAPLSIADQKELTRLEAYKEKLSLLKGELSSTTARTDLFAASTNRLNSIVTSVTGKIALAAGTMASFAIALSNSARNVASAIGPWQTLQFIGLEISSEFSDKKAGIFTRYGKTVSAAIGSIGAGLFKLVPVIGIVTIAWQVLGSLFRKIKSLLGFEDIAKLNEKLTEQADALDKSAEATANYAENLKDLPKTLENINDQLTLQSNVLGALSSDLKKVNDALAIDEGFGWWDELLDVVNAGDLDIFKENIDSVIKQVDKLGFGSSVSKEVRELADSFILGGAASEEMGKKLEETVVNLHRIAKGSQEANQAIIDGILQLNKSTAKLFGELPSLGGIDQTLSSITDLSFRLSTLDLETVADTLAGFSSVTLESLGLNETVQGIRELEIATALAAKNTEILKKHLETLTSPEEKLLAVPLLNAQIKAIADNLAKLEASVFEGLVNPLEKAVTKFDEISNSARQLKINLQSLALDKLIASTTSFDLVNNLKKETQLRVEAIRIQTQAALDGQKAISDDNDKIQNKKTKLATEFLKLKKDEEKNAQRLKEIEGELGSLATRKKANFDLDKKLQLQLDKTRGKSAELVSKLFKETTKEINKVRDAQASGVEGLEDKYKSLDATLKASVSNLVLLSKNTEAWGEALLNAQKHSEDTASFLKRERVANTEELTKQSYAIESANIEMEAQLAVSKNLNNELYTRADAQWQVADAIASANIAMQEQRVSEAFGEVEDSLEIETSAEAQANLETQEKLLAEMQRNRALADEKHLLSLRISIEKTAQSMAQELAFLQQEVALGARVSRMDEDSLKIAKLKAKLKGNDPKDIARIIKLQKDLNKEQRKFDFSKSLQESAEAMNDLADAMYNVTDSLSNKEFDSGVAAMQLLQELGSDISGDWGNWGEAAEGLATLANVSANYAKQLENINIREEEAQRIADENLVTLDTRSFELERQGAMLNNAANAAGALAGAFKQGTGAAKAFTVVQQGLALASAAVAVANAGTGDPYTAIARVAAMIAAMTSMLGAFGIGRSGGMTAEAGEKQVEDYKATIGKQGIVGRDLRSNTLVDGLDKIASIDGLLYGETKKLVNSMQNMEAIFSSMAAQLFKVYGADVSGLPVGTELGKSIKDKDLIGDISNITELIAENFLIIPTLGLSLLGRLGDKIGEEVNSFLRSTTTITKTLIDKGIDFTAAINTAGAGISGELEAQAFSVVQVYKKKKKSFGRGTKRSYWIEKYFADLDDEINSAFQDSFGNIVEGIDLLVTEFAGNISNIDFDALFGVLEGKEFSEKVSLKGLDEKEAAEAIGAFFSSLTSDIAETIFPFLENFRSAGEDLGDTLIRLTAESIKLNQAFSIGGENLSDFIPEDISLDTSQLLSQLTIDNDKLATDIEAYTSSFKTTTGSGTIAQAIIKMVNAKIEDGLVNFEDVKSVAEIEAIVASAAEAFKVEILASWNEAFLEPFGGDVDIASKFIESFMEQIYTESELAGFALTNATAGLSSGFTDLIEISEEMGRTDLADILREGGFDADTVALFYKTALATDAFAASVDPITGEFNVLGATLKATTIELAPLLASLEENQIAIENLNKKYIEQIALFGLVGKEADLLSLAFEFSDAIKEAEETGTDIALIEQAFGLERLEIIKSYYEEINDEISDAMNSVMDSIIQISQSSDVWDDAAFSIFKINKLVDRLNKGTNKLDLSELEISTEGLEEFANTFSNIVDSLSTEAPADILEEIGLVEQLREEVINKYELEMDLIKDVSDEYQQLAIDIQGWLDDIYLSDLSPLTNAEQLTEASNQFFKNIQDISSTDLDVAEAAREGLLDSATKYLEQAFEFFAIGDEYQKIFDTITSELNNLGLDFADLADDSNIQDKIAELNTDVISKLGVLDDILIELEAQNQFTLETDIADSITEGLLPEIANITTKLQDIDDGSWTTMIGLLATIADVMPEDVGTVSTAFADYDYGTRTGEIVQTLIDPAETPGLAVGTPYVPEDMLAQIHQGETIVPKSMAEGLREGTLTLGNTQDNTDVVEAIKELSLILATSQEDIVDATIKNIDVSQDIANSMANIRQPVSTSKVV